MHERNSAKCLHYSISLLIAFCGGWSETERPNRLRYFNLSSDDDTPIPCHLLGLIEMTLYPNVSSCLTVEYESPIIRVSAFNM